MSDALDSEAEPSSSNSGIAGAQVGPLAPEITDKEEMEEPEPKRRKLSKVEPKGFDKLEQRLGGILCCAVCLDLPKAAVYQCSNGHLMCAGCFTHVLADARLRDESATCPNCRVEISKDSATRNLAVENAISELPSECQYCSKEFARNSLNHHQDSLCEDRCQVGGQMTVSCDPVSPSTSSGSPVWLGGLWRRATLFCVMFAGMLRKPSKPRHPYNTQTSGPVRTVVCKYSCIGCPWRGPWHDNAAHEACCQHPRRSGADLLPALQAQQKEAQRNRQLYETLFSLLSYEKITFNELQFKPYRTDEYVNKLFYETTRFSAFNHQWVVKAHINNNQRDPTQSAQREISYQLILKTKTTATLSLHYVVLRGPFGDMRSTPRIYQCEFSERDTESPPSALVFPEDSECNRLLANKAINFRLIMFLSTK